MSITDRDQRRRQQTAQLLAKALAVDPPDRVKVERILRRHVEANDDAPRRAAPEALLQLFFAARDCLLQVGSTSLRHLASLAELMAKLVEDGGPGADSFYRTLLGRLLEEGESPEVATGAAKRATKEKILEAALEVFSTKGYYLATVEEIAELAGLGKGTVYRYFANKETLFHELVRSRLNELEGRAQEVLDTSDDVLTLIAKYLRIYFEFFDRNQRLYRVIVQEHLDFRHQMQDVYIQKVMRRVPFLKRKVYEATHRGVLKDVDFQTVFYGVMGFAHGVIQKWLAHDCAYSLLGELPLVTETLFFGFVKNDQASLEGVRRARHPQASSPVAALAAELAPGGPSGLTAVGATIACESVHRDIHERWRKK
jgi:AcrR family transcriptional regulator